MPDIVITFQQYLSFFLNIFSVAAIVIVAVSCPRIVVYSVIPDIH